MFRTVDDLNGGSSDQPPDIQIRYPGMKICRRKNTAGDMSCGFVSFCNSWPARFPADCLAVFRQPYQPVLTLFGFQNEGRKMRNTVYISSLPISISMHMKSLSGPLNRE